MFVFLSKEHFDALFIFFKKNLLWQRKMRRRIKKNEWHQWWLLACYAQFRVIALNIFSCTKTSNTHSMYTCIYLHFSHKFVVWCNKVMHSFTCCLCLVVDFRAMRCSCCCRCCFFFKPFQTGMNKCTRKWILNMKKRACQQWSSIRIMNVDPNGFVVSINKCSLLWSIRSKCLNFHINLNRSFLCSACWSECTLAHNNED